MFQVFHIGGLLQFEYLAANDADTRWTINRLSLSAVSGQDRSRWEVELQAERKRAVVGWHTFLVRYRPAEGSSASVFAFITEQLDGMQAELAKRTRSGGLLSIFARSKSRFATSETLWAPDGSYRQWFLPGIVIEADEKQQEREFLQSLVLGVEADRKLIASEADAAQSVQPVTPLALAEQPNALDDEIQPLADSYRDTFCRNLEQALANSRNLLSLSDRSNSPSTIESVINSTLHGAITMGLLEVGAQMFPDRELDVLCHVGDGHPEQSLAGESFAGQWPVQLPIWSHSFRTATSIFAQISLQPGTRGDRDQATQLIELVRTLLAEWLVQRKTALAGGGDGWVSLLPQVAWNEEMFAIWLGMATPMQKLTRLLDVVRHPPDPGDPHAPERATAVERLAQDVVTDSTGFDLDGWQVVASSLKALPSAQQQAFLGQLNQVLERQLADAACGPVEAGNWIGVWRAAAARNGSDRAFIFDSVLRRCAKEKQEDWSELLMGLWTKMGKDAATVPQVAETLVQANTAHSEWTSQLAESLEAADQRRVACELLMDCVHGAGNPDKSMDGTPLLPLAQSSARPDDWQPGADAAISAAVDAWAGELDRSQDVAGWQKLVAHRDQLRKLGLYRD